MRWVLLSILLTARNPITSREIAAAMIVERGVRVDDRLLNMTSRRCATGPRDLREKGQV